jgi:hypothetical protein
MGLIQLCVQSRNLRSYFLVFTAFPLRVLVGGQDRGINRLYSDGKTSDLEVQAVLPLERTLRSWSISL